MVFPFGLRLAFVFPHVQTVIRVRRDSTAFTEDIAADSDKAFEMIMRSF